MLLTIQDVEEMTNSLRNRRIGMDILEDISKEFI